MLTEIKRTMHEQSMNFKKKIENVLKIPNRNTDLKNTIIGLRNSLEGFNISLDQAQERISKIHRKVIGNNLDRGEKVKKT